MSAGGGVQVTGPVEESDQLIIRPLGAGQEVGRSCIMLEFKGKKIMLDIGIHPGHTGMEALPFVDFIDADEVDLLLVSHFHLDHSGALPWFLLKTAFKGRCFMTHATKAIYRWLLSDYIKVSNISSDHILYTEQDLEASMEKIEVLNFHEEKEVKGIKFWAYHAGHVLGAAMFMIEIAGVKVLYTGDFSRQEDRHLMAAEIPTVKPDVMIVESTYGTHIHEKREERESRFTGIIHEIVSRGGRCLIPVFALGRAQELLLILDEYWGLHPELHEIPIYYASSLAKKCMAVYQTYINAMNEKIRRQIAINNPFIFKHISNLKSIDHFEDVGPCVVMASPGMMQSGLSREMFEMWCTDPKNGVIIAGYCVEGTLAKQILSEPEDVTLMNGSKAPLKMSVDYISFSAHTDYEQTSEFIRILKPPNIVLVHGEANEMSRLKAALLREFEGEKMDIYNPKNTQAVTLHFRGEKMAKVMGSLASSVTGERGKTKKLSGILVKRNFNYHILAPSDLPKYTDLTLSTVTQRQSISYSGTFDQLRQSLVQLAKDVEVLKKKSTTVLRVFGSIDIQHNDEGDKFVIIEWIASPVNDMYADAVLTCVLQQGDTVEDDIAPPGIVSNVKMDSSFEHFKECVIDTLQDMFGRDCIPKAFCSNKKSETNAAGSGGGQEIKVIVNGHEASLDFDKLEVTCPTDPELEQIVQSALMRLHSTLVPL